MTLKAIPMLLLLVFSVLVMPSVYATPTDDNKKEEPKTDEPTKESEPAKEAEPEPKTPEPEATPSEELKIAGVVVGAPTTAAATTTTEQENKLAAIESNDNGDIEPCLLDPSLPSCPKPGPDQDCPEGWAQNEDGNCFPLHPDGCPEGYHGHEDDETGRCIPNSTPCDPGYEFNDDHSNCEKEHFTCDGKPSVVPCKDRDDNNNDNDNDHDHHTGDHNKDIIIKHITNKKVVEKIVESDNNLDIDQTIVAISYDEGKGLNCVIMEDNEGQCETFDVDKDKGKDPFLAVVQFD